LNWLPSVSTTFGNLAASTSSAVTQLGAPRLAWSAITSVAQAASALAQQRVQLVTQLAAALGAAGPPQDGSTLANFLLGITDLRVSAWPEARGATPGFGSYAYRMAELDDALAGVLRAPTGVAANVPAAMLPVRLETRMAAGAHGGTEIRVRIFPDDVH